MYHLLSKLLKKRGVDSTEELTKDEKETYQNLEKNIDRVMKLKDITVEDIKNLCDEELKKIEKQWENLDNGAVKNERLVILHTIYSKLLMFIDAPNEERRSMEKYLNSLINNV